MVCVQRSGAPVWDWSHAPAPAQSEERGSWRTSHCQCAPRTCPHGQQSGARPAAAPTTRRASRARADLERELLAVDREEAKLVKEIRAAAARGNEAAARTLAKSLVRQRGQKAKLHAGILQMRGVRSTLATTAATSSVGASMATATAAMQAVGAAADPQKTMAAVQQFSRENAHMDMARLARPASALQTRCRGCHAPVGGWTPVVSPACFSPVSHCKLSSEWKLVGAAHSLEMPWRRW